jgi:hypothetical protein
MEEKWSRIVSNKKPNVNGKEIDITYQSL